MNKLIKVAVDAMGGDNAPQKIIDGIELHHKKSKNTFYRLYGNKNIIEPAINKKMKEYVNLMYAIIDKVELWENLDSRSKVNFFSEFIDVDKKSSFFVNYFEKYALYLSKNSFNYFTKDVISLKF